MNLSRNQISFLRDVHPSVEIDKTSKWEYHVFKQFDIYEINNFIKLIEQEQIYLMIPQFSASNSETTLVLSAPFLVNNQSNTELICKWIYDQWQSCGFINTRKIVVIFKYKKVSYSYKD